MLDASHIRQLVCRVIVERGIDPDVRGQNLGSIARQIVSILYGRRQGKRWITI
jgi:hypothetical protein